MAASNTFQHESKTMFWDIEALSSTGGFTNSKLKEDEIHMISVVISQNKNTKMYLYVRKEILKPLPNVTVILCETERDLLLSFHNLCILESPQFFVHFNGFSYDEPYVVERSRLHNVKIQTYTEKYMGFGSCEAEAIYLENTQHIDLMQITKLFYPGLPRYNLDSISDMFIGETKTGLDIHEAFDIMRSKDSERLFVLAQYSIQDTVLLHKLWKRMDIHSKMTRTCTAINCTYEDLSRKSSQWLMAKTIQAATKDVKMPWISSSSKLDHLTNTPPGYYSRVHIYSYNDLYIEVLRESYEEMKGFLLPSLRTIVVKFLDMLKYVPEFVVPSFFTSDALHQIFNQNYLIKRLKCKINGLTTNDVIRIEKYVIYTRKCFKSPGLKLERVYDHVISINEKNMLIRNNGKYFVKGRHLVCSRPYSLIERIVDKYLSDGKVEHPNIEKEPLKNLEFTYKIYPSSFYKSKGSCYNIAKEIEVEHPISQFQHVTLHNTLNGIERNVSSFEDLDLTKYEKDVETVIDVLNKLPRNDNLKIVCSHLKQ